MLQCFRIQVHCLHMKHMLEYAYGCSYKIVEKDTQNTCAEGADSSQPA